VCLKNWHLHFNRFEIQRLIHNPDIKRYLNTVLLLQSLHGTKQNTPVARPSLTKKDCKQNRSVLELYDRRRANENNNAHNLQITTELFSCFYNIILVQEIFSKTSAVSKTKIIEF